MRKETDSQPESLECGLLLRGGERLVETKSATIASSRVRINIKQAIKLFHADPFLALRVNMRM